MVEVFAAKGPLAGRRIELPEDKVDAATGKDGWALKLEPGVQLLADPGAAYDAGWEIPGYTRADLEPFVSKGPRDAASKEPIAKTTDLKEGQTKTTDGKTTAKEDDNGNGDKAKK